MTLSIFITNLNTPTALAIGPWFANNSERLEVDMPEGMAVAMLSKRLHSSCTPFYLSRRSQFLARPVTAIDRITPKLPVARATSDISIDPGNESAVVLTDVGVKSMAPGNLSQPQSLELLGESLPQNPFRSVLS